MNFEHIQFEVSDRIAVITLNRPDQLNAWTAVMMEEILQALDTVEADDEIRVVIFTGAGRAFCAGADLSSGGFGGLGDAKEIQWDRRDTAGRVTLKMYDMKKPVIGAINGVAVGVGMTFTLAMDVRIAADNIPKMGFVFNRRGIVPEGCSTFFLPRIVGISRASELVLTGRLFSSREALEMGLVSRLTTPDALMDTAREIAEDIAGNTSAVSAALARQMLWKGLGEDHPMAAHIRESMGLNYMFVSPDCREGVQSFFEKRAPKFRMKTSSEMPYFFPWWEPKEFKID